MKDEEKEVKAALTVPELPKKGLLQVLGKSLEVPPISLR